MTAVAIAVAAAAVDVAGCVKPLLWLLYSCLSCASSFFGTVFFLRRLHTRLKLFYTCAHPFEEQRAMLCGLRNEGVGVGVCM